MVTRRLLVLGLGDLLGDADGAVLHVDLHGQHLLATGLEIGEQPVQLLLAQLAQEVFQLLLGVLEFLNRVVLVLLARLLVVLVDVVLGPLLVVASFLDAFLGLGGIVLRPAGRLGRLLLAVVVVALLGAGRGTFLGAAVALGLALSGTLAAGLGLARLAFGLAAALGIGGLGFAALAALGVALLAVALVGLGLAGLLVLFLARAGRWGGLDAFFAGAGSRSILW